MGCSGQEPHGNECVRDGWEEPGQMDPRSPCRYWMKGHLENTPMGGGVNVRSGLPCSHRSCQVGVHRIGVVEVLESNGPVLERTPAR